MSRRTAETVTVQLFPFLAVLVCTMGSLIFLLLVTTRQIRVRALACLALERQQQTVIAEKSSFPVKSAVKITPHTNSVPADLAEETKSEDDSIAYAQALNQRRQEQERLNSEWAEKARQLEQQRDQRRESLVHRRSLVAAAASQTEAVRSEVKESELQLGQLAGESAAASMTSTTEAEQMAIDQKIAEMKRRLKAAQAAEANSENDQFQVIPFDAVSGTARRPILIECTIMGIRFLPENILITAADLEGFTQRANPLAAGTAALIAYWKEWNTKQKNPKSQPEPYPLLLVRPDGEVAYYVAIKMLEALNFPRGYELIEDHTNLALPEIDPGAKVALETAIRRLMSERENIYRAALQSRSGPAVFGRAPRNGGSGRPSKTDDSRTDDANDGNGSRSKGSPGFTMNDIEPAADDIGSRSWERIENFQGKRKKSNSSRGSGNPDGDARISESNNAPDSDANEGNLVRESGRVKKSTIRSARGDRRSEKEAGDEGSDEESTVRKQGFNETDEDETSDGSEEHATSDDFGEDRAPRGERNSSRLTEASAPGESGDGGAMGNRQRRPPAGRQRPLEPEMLAGRHWGQSEAGAAIGFENDVRVAVYEDKIVIAEKYEIRVEKGQTRQELFELFTSALDHHAQEWGRPPQGFFWTPRLKFVVRPEATAVYEKVNSLMTRSGIATSLEYTKPDGSDQTSSKSSATRKPAPRSAIKPAAGDRK